MKFGFFPKLAWTGIKNNRKLYIPYILSCMGMILMFYIIHSLSCSPLLDNMMGGTAMGEILSLGKLVIIIFASIFLIYTNSFLIRRRYKEFGLYNILGMDKHSISRIVAWESVIVAIISLVGGLALGIALSKLAELGLLNVIKKDVDYTFTVSGKAVAMTAELFAAVFAMLFVKSIIQVRIAKPLELLKSENKGEKPPKANWVFAVVGLILIGVAYYLAVSIKTPLSAFVVFFVAVVMVIIGTYLLFISGSVAACKLLQKTKDFYYKKKNFVSVSSMIYRMKRNGAGLASICILSTMVLVTLTTTSSLYVGIEDIITTRNPLDSQMRLLNIEGVEHSKEETISAVRNEYEKAFDKYGVHPTEVKEIYFASIAGLAKENEIVLDVSKENFNVDSYDDLRSVYFVAEDDYNRAMGTDISVKPGEAMYGTLRCELGEGKLKIGDVDFELVGEIENCSAFFSFNEALISINPSILLVVHDLDAIRPFESLVDYNGNPMLNEAWYYGYNLDADIETQKDILNAQTDSLADTLDGGYSYSYSNGSEDREVSYGMVGGLFFIGIALSIIFIFAAAMIIYYKQISEGYEDQSRFEIMQKVGMTKTDIKKSVNSQILIVFFAPLVMAALHLGFSFPLIWKIMQLFALQNLKLAIITSIVAFAIFAIIYAMIYRITAGAYYKIVSEMEK